MNERGRYGGYFVSQPAEKLGAWVNLHFNSAVPFIGLVILAFILYDLYVRIQLHIQRKEFQEKNGCKPISSIVPNDPTGLRFLFRLLAHSRNNEMLPFLDSLSKQYGKTYLIDSWRRTSYFTISAENLKALLSTKFDDYAVQSIRHEATYELLGNGVFTTDGAYWSHSRAMLRPAFEKQQVADLDQFERYINALISRIPKDGSTVDLQPLFGQFATDVSTELLTGETTDILGGGNPGALDFAAKFDYAMEDGVKRMRLGPVYWLTPRFKALQAVRACKAYMQRYVDSAIRRKAEVGETGDAKPKSKGKFVFLDELAKEEGVDATRMRDEIMGILFAGRDTSANLLSALWFELARAPKVWEKLQAEVDELHGNLPNHEKLRDMTYLRHCVQEALRLHTPVPFLSKVAIRDTVLPRGGGPDGQSPLFVRKGAMVGYNLYSLHRQPDVYGDDSDQYNPDRWADSSLRPGWNFIPFGGGPRLCLGQQFALNETYYVTIRLMQEFRRVEARDSAPWKEKLILTATSLNGVQIGLFAS